MNSRSIQTIAFIFIAICIGIWTGISILLNPTGGIAGLSKLVTILCVGVSFVNPKMGLYCLAAQAIYSDELKRVGVYYGAVSMQTVQEILIGPLLTLLALNAGFVVQMAMGKIKFDKFGWLLYGIAPALGLYFFFGGAIAGGDSFSKKMYNAGTAGLYTTLIPICYGLMRNFKEWVRFLSFQVTLIVPCAAWGVWQYYNGFNSMEWAYASSGLSMTHSAQMLSFEEPRIFGLFGSASALGCLCGYFSYTAWRTYSIPKFRWWFLLIAILLFATLVYSKQRTALVSPLIFGLFAFAFRRRITTLMIYGTVFGMLMAGIFSSTWLLNEGINKINTAIAIDTKWGRDVLNVNTFSDRLRGWERLTRASSWSLLGTGGDDTLSDTAVEGEELSHDMINRILMKAGVVGLSAILLFAGGIVFTLHRAVWRLPDKDSRRAGAFALGVAIPLIIMSATGGDNFTATPYNLMIWSIFAGVFVLLGIHAPKKTTMSQQAALGSANPPLVMAPAAGTHSMAARRN